MIFHLDIVIGAEVVALLEQHRAAMEDTTPVESRHALDADGLRRPDVSFWTLHLDDALVGCGALKHLDPGHAEIKAMRTAKTHLKRGLGKAMLDHLMAEATRSGYRRLSLETGAMAHFRAGAPALSCGRVRTLPAVRRLCRRSQHRFPDASAGRDRLSPCRPC